MNIIKFLDELSLEGKSKDELDIFTSRREAFGKLTNFSKKLAVTALPAGIFAAMPTIAFAQSAATPETILNFALTLEYLEAEFYQMGMDAAGLDKGVYADVIDQIRKHEVAHVAFLQDTIESIGGTPVTKPTFDFTGGKGGPDGPFGDVFTNFQTYLTLAQAFEDTGVRAYKGQAANILNPDDELNRQLLTSALSIHGVEARHASMVRRIRELKGWITGGPGDNALPEVAQGVYGAGMPPEMFPSEANVMQAGYDTSAEFGVPAGTESFDEPLDADTAAGTGTVYNIASLFIVP